MQEPKASELPEQTRYQIEIVEFYRWPAKHTCIKNWGYATIETEQRSGMPKQTFKTLQKLQV
jgi:hypothetical protein